MSFAVSPFHVLRSCRASLASRNLSRSVFSGSHTYHRIGTRRYSSNQKSSSSETTPPQAEASKNGDKAEPSAEVDPCADVKNTVKAKEAEVLDLTSRLRYLQADFLNLQRNAAREKEQTKDYAISRFAGDLLETVDVLSIALKSVPPEAVDPSSTSSESQPPTDTSSSAPLPKSHAAYLRELHTGVEMTHRLLLQTLFKYHVKPFDPTGDKFDPNQHEALYQVPMPGKEPGTIIDCQKTGYMIKDRVLRAAQVGVAQELS